MPATYEPIASTTLGSAQSSISFASIPNTYTDLRLIVVRASGVATGYAYMQFNNTNTSTYSCTYFFSNGSGVGSGRTTTTNSTTGYIAGPFPASYPAFIQLDVFNYTGSTNKTTLVTSDYDGNGSGETFRSVVMWGSTAVVNRIDVFTNAGTNSWPTGTTATLYGIKAA